MIQPVGHRIRLFVLALALGWLLTGCVASKTVRQPSPAAEPEVPSPPAAAQDSSVSVATTAERESAEVSPPDSVRPAPVTSRTTTQPPEQAAGEDEMAARSAAEVFGIPAADTLVEGAGDTTTLDSSRLALVNRSFTVDSDSTGAESTREESELDTSIVYGGRELLFDVKSRTSIIRGNARIQYKKMTLSAYEILVDWENDLMTAIPRLDTLWTDSTQTEVDTVKIIGMPTFKQGGTTMNGTLMRVNMKTKAGYVEGGTTEYGEGWYKGQRIQKVSDDVFFIQNGTFTSCDLEHPHFHFVGNEMKMIRGDKVVGKPVILEFGDVPVAALPFSVFSIKPGRHSGILVPTYGDNSSQGRSLQNFGYYWAASQYWDLKSIVDYFERRGFRFRSNLIYRKKNAFNGSLSGSYELNRGESTRWNFSPVHNQQFNKYTRLRVKGDFVSNNNFYREQSTNLNQQLTQTIRSNATFSTRWPNRGVSLTVNLNQSRNLVTGEHSETLPNFSMSFGSHQLFPTAESRRSSDKSLIYEPPQERIAPGEERPEDTERWYNRITYTYSNGGQFKRDYRLSTSGDDSVYTNDEEGYVSHRGSINAPQRIFKYITLNPSMSFKEDWMFERYNWYYDSTGAEQYTKEEGFFPRHTFSTSLSTNTKFYGMFPVGHWGIETIRHVVSPSVGMSWRPDFSDREWDYYQRLSGYFYDAEDDTTIYESAIKDRYYRSAAGGTGSGRSLSLNFSLGNLFQMKTLTVDAQGKENERKLDLFRVDMSSNYNFIADSLNFGQLSTRVSSNPLSSRKRLGPLNRLSLDLSLRHSFYALDDESGRQINQFYFDSPQAGPGDLLRLVSLSSSANFGMTIQNPFLHRGAKIVFEEQQPDTVDQEELEIQQLRESFDNKYNDFGESDQPVGTRGAKQGGLDLSGRLAYSLNRSDPTNVRKSLFLSGNVSFKLTRNWTVGYNTGVDLISREVNVGTLNVNRDLHCWKMSFRWSPKGVGSGIFLYIGVKSSMLHDLKWEHKTGRGNLSF